MATTKKARLPRKTKAAKKTATAKRRAGTIKKAAKHPELNAKRREEYQKKDLVSIAFRVNTKKHGRITKAAAAAGLSLDGWCNKIADEAIEAAKHRAVEPEQTELEEAIEQAGDTETQEAA